MLNNQNVLSDRNWAIQETPEAKLSREVLANIGKFPKQISERLNSPDFQSQMSKIIGSAWQKPLKDYANAKLSAQSPDIWEAKNAPRRNSDSNPGTYTEKFLENSWNRISDTLATLEWRGDKEKKLASLLKACKENPSQNNVLALQNSLMADWGKTVSKNGKPDGHFGPMTLSALQNVAWTHGDSPSVAKKPDSLTGSKAETAKFSEEDENRIAEAKVGEKITLPDGTVVTVLESRDITEPIPNSSEKVPQSPTGESEKAESKEKSMDAIWQKVTANGDRLKSEIAVIKGQTNLFNISSQVDKATPIVKKYLQENVNDLTLLADNQSSLNPETKGKIASQLKELADWLRKWASSGMVSESSRSQMAKWFPEVDKILSRFS